MGQMLIGTSHGTSPVWQMFEAWHVAICAAIALGDDWRARILSEMYADKVAMETSNRWEA